LFACGILFSDVKSNVPPPIKSKADVEWVKTLTLHLKLIRYKTTAIILGASALMAS
jgi:hypothetical protein